MALTEIKKTITISLDDFREKDIINMVEELSTKKQFGDYVTMLIKASVDNPELIGLSRVDMEEYSRKDNREQFFTQVEKDVNNMKRKIDSIFDMALSMYTLAQFGKRIGLEDRSKNMLQANFILQQQMNRLTETLGVQSIGQVYESNRIDLAQRKVDEILEYIVTSHDSIVSEIKSNLDNSKQIVYVQSDPTKNPSDAIDTKILPVNNINTSNQGDSIITIKNEQKDKNDTNINKEDSQNNSSKLLTNSEENSGDDEVIDFGSKADWDMLNIFTGEG